MQTYSKLFLLLVSVSCGSALAMKSGPSTTSGDHYEGRGNCLSGYGSGHCTSSGNASSSGNDRAGGGMSGMEAFTAGFSIGANIMLSAASRNPGKFLENVKAAGSLVSSQPVATPINPQGVQWNAAGMALSQEERNRIEARINAQCFPNSSKK